jgi:hypothetical protein
MNEDWGGARMRDDDSRPAEPVIRWRDGVTSRWVGSTLVTEAADAPATPTLVLAHKVCDGNEELARNLLRFASGVSDQHIASISEVPLSRIQEMRRERRVT